MLVLTVTAAMFLVCTPIIAVTKAIESNPKAKAYVDNFIQNLINKY